MSADPGLRSLLTTIFKTWNEGGITFLILRNYEMLPDATSNDVDVLLSSIQHKSAEILMIRAARKCGYELHNKVEFATISYFFYHPSSLQQIQIDLFTKTRWHCLDLVPTEDVLARRTQRPLFSVPHPVDEAVISLLGRLIYRGFVRESYKERIKAGLEADSELATRLLKASFGQDHASAIVKHGLTGEWQQIERLAPELRRRLIFRSAFGKPLASLWSLLGDMRRFLKRLQHPAGIFVVVLGADGSGKSTVSQQTVEALKNTFNPSKMLKVHWKPGVFFKARRQGQGSPVIDPHGRPSRGRFASMLYLLFHWVEYMVGSHLLFRKTIFRNGLVLADRYHYDFLVDPRRFRLRASPMIIRCLFRFTKPPDLVFLLDASAETLQSRKREVPFEETERQIAAYRTLVSRLPQGRILDASRSVEELTQDMTSNVLELLQRRLRSRERGRLTAMYK